MKPVTGAELQDALAVVRQAQDLVEGLLDRAMSNDQELVLPFIGKRFGSWAVLEIAAGQLREASQFVE
jgi:hypothetical protein